MTSMRRRRASTAKAWVGAAVIVALWTAVAAASTQEAQSEQIESGTKTKPTSISAREAPIQDIEIREYQGERLGSADDFRENSIRGVQNVDRDAYFLVLDGLVDLPASWSYDELAEMDHEAKLVTLHCVEGWSVKALWEGIPLAALLEQARPHERANTVIFHAADGYTTSLALDVIVDRDLIIADRINGIVLPPRNGFPFQLVAEDKWGYKWIKWIVRIELSDDPSYRGFWESRGYSNGGDADGPMFGD